MLEIEKVYFAEGAATTKAGLQRFIAENPHKEIIIIDEIDKMPMKDQEGLLTGAGPVTGGATSGSSK